MRAEHNCHLCKKEWLGRCLEPKHYGMSVSMDGDREENKKLNGKWADGDLPVCDEYEFCGSEEKLEAIKYAESIGVTELPDDWKENLEDG